MNILITDKLYIGSGNDVKDYISIEEKEKTAEFEINQLFQNCNVILSYLNVIKRYEIETYEKLLKFQCLKNGNT